MIATVPGRGGLAEHGIDVRGRIHWQPTTSQLYMHALARGEARLAEGGPLVVDTGKHTGRSPKDKFVVREPGSEYRIWWGDVNAEISEASRDRVDVLGCGIDEQACELRHVVVRELLGLSEVDETQLA